MLSRLTGSQIVIAPTPAAHFGASALDDEVLANTPRQPAAADIHAILLAC
jgi:hypothetical protein